VAVSRSGTTITLRLEADLSPSEVSAIRTALTTKNDLETALVGSLESISKSAPLDGHMLATLSSPELSAWLLSPKATPADCTELVTKIDGFKVPLEKFGQKFQLKAQFEKCTGMRLPPALKKCFVDAADITIFQACKGPSLPTGKP
jgi:hypothetical protein